MCVGEDGKQRGTSQGLVGRDILSEGRGQERLGLWMEWSLQAMQCLPDRYRGQQEGWSGGGTVLAKVWQCGSLWELFVVFAAGGRSGCDGLRGQTGLETRGLWSRSPGIHTRSLGSHGPGILAA